MTGTQQARTGAAGLLLVALVGFWQAWPLERWSFDGPGPGFFPQMVAAVCVLLSLLVLVWPGKVADEAADDATEAAAVSTRGTFALYGLALFVLALGMVFAGFTVTALVTTVIVMRFAERRSWLLSIGFAVAVSLVCLLLFGWLLRVDMPTGVVDDVILRLVR